jgi:hypothetical protein
MKALIATWFNPDHDNMGLPHELRWSDGTRASMNDFYANLDSTFRWKFLSPICVEKHCFPDLIATVEYDEVARRWVVTGENIEPFGLLVDDPNATDEEIDSEMFAGEIVYRFRIVRTAAA